MWLRLKKPDGQEILVNMDLVVSIEPVSDGAGSKLISIAPNKDTVRSITVQQPIKVLKSLLSVDNELSLRVA